MWRTELKVLAAVAVASALFATGTASAQQPIQPLGEQLRLTQQGVDGDANVDAQQVDVAYNSQRNEFLAVWENRVVGDTEIFGRRLDADGTPIAAPFQISGLSDVPGFSAAEPAVAYDFERDRYCVVFTRDDSVDNEREVFAQFVTGDGALISATGVLGASPQRASNIGNNDDPLQAADDPDVTYRPDVSGDADPGDAFVVSYVGDEAVNGQSNAFLTRIPAASPVGAVDRDVSAMTATGDAFETSIATVPGSDDVVVAWRGFLSGADSEIFVNRIAGALPDNNGASQKAITATGGAAGATSNAFEPTITANPDASHLAIAYRADAVNNDFEIHLQRLDFGLGKIGTEAQQVSSAGPAGTGSPFTVASPAVSYHPGLARYLVTWIGNDVDRPGFASDEEEVTGAVLDADGVELAPEDFAISRMGAANDDAPFPSDATVVANTQTGRWLSVWSSDDAQPPLADNEFELFGRQVGENFDVDGDGVNVPADCNDGNAGIRPGAVDVFDNGVDEDCSGADAENPDRDGDGATRPGDCDDGNPAIRPGIAEVVNNEVDENCDRQFGRAIVDVDVERFFAVFTNHTRVTRLRVRKLLPGMRIELRCSGKKCPKELRKGKVRRVSVKKAGSRDFTKLFKKARLRPKAVIDVRVFQPSAIARVDRFVMRKAKLPTRQLRCIPPGAKKPAKC